MRRGRARCRVEDDADAEFVGGALEADGDGHAWCIGLSPRCRVECTVLNDFVSTFTWSQMSCIYPTLCMGHGGGSTRAHVRGSGAATRLPHSVRPDPEHPPLSPLDSLRLSSATSLHSRTRSQTTRPPHASILPSNRTNCRAQQHRQHVVVRLQEECAAAGRNSRICEVSANAKHRSAARRRRS